MARSVVRRKGEGKPLVDGSLKARHMAVEEIISLSAQITSTIIANAHVTTLSAAKLLTVVGAALSAIGTNAALGAQDPAVRINAGTTRIDPVRVLIAGGKIAANTIKANAIEIGNHDLALSGTRLEADPAGNVPTWTAGKLHWTDDSGSAQATDIAAGTFIWSSGTAYVCWNKDEGVLIIQSALIGTLVANVGHISGTLSAARISAGTALSTVRDNAATGAQDPGTRINQGSTKIDPGKITISGPTTLLDWQASPTRPRSTAA